MPIGFWCGPEGGDPGAATATELYRNVGFCAPGTIGGLSRSVRTGPGPEPWTPHPRLIRMQPSLSQLVAGTALLLGATLLGGCSQAGPGAGLGAPPSPSPGELRTIAKDDAVPPAGVTPSFSTLLVVPDDLVDVVLIDVGVDQLPRVDGAPLQTGTYADFTGVDDLGPGEVLALWYSGQSGTCPTFLTGLHVTAEGDVNVAEFDTGPGGCDGDYNSYRQLVVLPDSATPAMSELPFTLVGEEGTNVDDLLVDVYPASPAP